MLFEEVNIEDLLKKGEKIYYYNKWFYAHIRRQENLNPLEGPTLFLKSTILDFKTILLVFDRILIPISHILTLVHESEFRILQDLFNNDFVKNLINQGLIIFSIWYTNESLSPEYFIEINKEYLTASGWSLKGDWYIPIQRFPVNNEKLYVYKRPVAKQSKDFKNFYIQTLDFLKYSKKLEIDKKELEEIQKAINNGEWTIKTADAYIPFSMEKFFYDVKIKEEYKYWRPEHMNLSVELAKSAYYKAGETGNGGYVFLPLDLKDEIAINRTTYNGEIYAFLLSPFFLRKLILSILNIELERVTLKKLMLLREQHCFKEFQDFFIYLLKQITKFIKDENPLNSFSFKTQIDDKDELDKVAEKILKITNSIIHEVEGGKFLKQILQILTFLIKMILNQDFSGIKVFIENVLSKKEALQYYYDNKMFKLSAKCLKNIEKIIMENDINTNKLVDPIIPIKQK